MEGNLGQLFYRDYYQNPDNINQINNHILESKIIDTSYNSPHGFNLETIYPGLLIGSGYNHEFDGNEEAFKIGFFFDHTTGMPIIPASSVKGVLRSAFKHPEYIIDLLNENDIKDIDISQLEQEIFVGKRSEKEFIPIPKRDVFLNAVPIESNNEGTRLLGSDYITPHKNALKNPTPIKFLKVLPQVMFKFQFILRDGTICATAKESLFLQIILDLGIGAKTNVGYGQFDETEESKKARKQKLRDEKKIIEQAIIIAKTKQIALDNEKKERERLEKIANQKKSLEEQRKVKHIEAVNNGIKILLLQDKIITGISSKMNSWCKNYHGKKMADVEIPVIPLAMMNEFITHIKHLKENAKGKDTKAWKALDKGAKKEYNDIYKCLLPLIGKDNIERIL